MKTIALIIIFVLMLICYETIICIKRKINRRRIFSLAKERSIKTGLPLLVVGDPYNGLASIVTGIDYGCGDICIDLTGCNKCPSKIKEKLENVVQRIDLNGYIVFISCVLEYVDDLPLIVSYLNKMDPKNLFIVSVEWYCLMSRFYPYFLTNEEPAKNIIYEAPPKSDSIRSRELRQP
jgi:hypothetical protein